MKKAHALLIIDLRNKLKAADVVDPVIEELYSDTLCRSLVPREICRIEMLAIQFNVDLGRYGLMQKEGA